MIRWLLTREAAIALAVLGAIASVFASVLQLGGRISPERVKQLNLLGYAFMATSMLLFIIIGLGFTAS